MLDLHFTKMHASGNDFVLIDSQQAAAGSHLNKDWAPTQAHIIAMADRRRGIGCDQVLLISHCNTAAADFHYRIFNADGSHAEQCGNGARCIARYLQRYHPQNSPEWRLIHPSGDITLLQLDANQQINVNMGIPKFNPSSIPFTANAQARYYKITIAGEQFEIGVVNMGNPHTIIQVPDLNCAPVDKLGKAINQLPHFPQGTNLGFIQVLDKTTLKLRVFERGVGETPACGSGACAAMAVAHSWGLVSNQVTVQQQGGTQDISWQGAGSHMIQSGAAHFVYTGVWSPA